MDCKNKSFNIETINDESKIISAMNKQAKFLHECISSLTIVNEGKLVKGDIEGDLNNFNEMFVWCPLHSHYICSCRGQIFNLKNNLLKNPKTDVATKNMSLDHFFNVEDHCTRTIGSIIDYKLRNSSCIYTVKRLIEIKKDILSNSNSLFKVDIHSQKSSQSEASTTIEPNSPKRAKNRRKLGRNNGLHYNELISFHLSKFVNPKFGPIYHHFERSKEEVLDSSHLPKYGLLCLNGNGYLPIKEYNSTKLVFQHPVLKKVFVCKKDDNEANFWLNNLLKSLDLQYTAQKWVVVQREVLKISKPFYMKNMKNDEQLAE